MNGTTTDAAASAPRKNPTWVVATIAGGFGVFYAYAVWNALGNLIEAAPLGLNGLGWFLWIFATVFPILALAAAFAVGFRRPVHHFFLVMLTGLALTAVFWLNVVAYTTTNTLSLLT
ncbi:bacitracin resistance protein [Microbacterium pumilum]|uniref:Bacitracin resistance protein n=1 Tax=Microbacterium pumilum TaxID=344165 RepID=A0ABN2SSG6_9MICO